MSNNNIVAGVNIDDIGEGKTSEARLSSIVDPFNDVLVKLVQLAIQYDQSKTDHIDRIRKLILWGKEYPDLMIRKCYKNLTNIENKKAIIERNLDHFSRKDYNKFIKKDMYKDTIDFALNYIRKDINNLSEQEMNYIWDLISILAICSEEYKCFIHE